MLFQAKVPNWPPWDLSPRREAKTHTVTSTVELPSIEIRMTAEEATCYKEKQLDKKLKELAEKEVLLDKRLFWRGTATWVTIITMSYAVIMLLRN